MKASTKESAMPLVRITLRADLPARTQRDIADGVHTALVEAIGIPVADRFQIISTRPADALIFDPDYLGVARQDLVAVEITLVRGRSVALKKALFAGIATQLGKVGVRPADVLITLTEVGREDFSVGNGEAQLLDTELLARHGVTPPGN
jgi:phenylpyruvate tautomerase PptA (4-oxalocrotonate tautomerase family)